MAMRLHGAGAQALAIACNTAHAYAPAISRAVPLPLLDMIELTASRIATMPLRHRRVGMLASTAVVNLGLYKNALDGHGIAIVAPQGRAELMGVIKAVKRGDTGEATRNSFARIADDLADHDVDILVIACTELSVIADSLSARVPCVDALDVLASEIVTFGTGQRNQEHGNGHHLS